MINKSIHLIWLPSATDAVTAPAEVQTIVDLWRASEPNLAVKLWESSELEAELTDVEGRPVWKTIQSCRFPSMQADVASLALVYKNGGFWSALKNRPLATFVEFLSELDGFIVAEHFPVASRPNPINYLCNSFFGSHKGDRFLQVCLDNSLSNIDGRKSASPPTITGSAMMAESYNALKNSDTPSELRLLNYSEFWGRLLKRVPLSYDKNDMHWSKRYKRESLYTDK